MEKTVLITGCSSGIGKASARCFFDAGWNVIATMRNPADHGPSSDQLPEHERMLITALDVKVANTITAAIDCGIAQFGKVDVLINNAGFGLTGLFETTSAAEIKEQFDVNLFGLMDVTRAILPHFRSRKEGVIVNVSSGAGIFTLPMLSLYCASKFALEGFSESLSYELLSQNIVVKIVQPHGGVAGTKFPEKAAQQREKSPPDPEIFKDYGNFVVKTVKAYENMVAAITISSEDVARTIFEAATDGSQQLRYLVGDDSRGFVRARAELSEPDYVEFMRSKF